MVLMHVGRTGSLCPLPRPKSWEPCPSKEVPHCPQTQTSNVLRVHKKGSQINMPECHQGSHSCKRKGWGFLPSPVIFQSPQGQEAPCQVPLWSCCMEKGAPSPEPSLPVTQKSPEMKPLLQVPLTEPLHRGRCSISRALSTYLSRSPVQSP
jgi:hypothetical protein